MSKEAKILLVDDETDILEIVGYNLSQEGYQIVTAVNGREAVAKAKKELPQLIIMDVMMPEMDGFGWFPFSEIPQLCSPKLVAVLTQRLDLPGLLSRLPQSPVLEVQV